MSGSVLNEKYIPKGIISLWYGSIASIPAGWALCNGSSGTPDLRDKFIVGAKQDDGGTAKTNITGSLLQSGGAGTHTHIPTVGNMAASGGDFATDTSPYSTESNIPPFFALAYIMKL